MSRNRRTHSKDFKAKVVLEALREASTIEALVKKYELFPTQISAWKAEAVKNISAIFSAAKEKKPVQDIPYEKLFARIGQLTLENDFLKKASMMPSQQRKERVSPREKISISRQCHVLGLKRGFLYYMPASKSAENLQMMKLLDENEQYLKPLFYGSRKKAAMLQEKGFEVNEKQIRQSLGYKTPSQMYKQKLAA